MGKEMVLVPYKVPRDARGSGSGRGGEHSGLHYGELFCVSLMRWSNGDLVTSVETLVGSSGENIQAEFVGDVTEAFKSDEDCVKAFQPEQILQIMALMRERGIEQGRALKAREIREVLGVYE